MIHDFLGMNHGVQEISQTQVRKKIIAEGEIPFCYFDINPHVSENFAQELPLEASQAVFWSLFGFNEQKLPKTPLISPVLYGLPFSDAKYSCMCRKQNFEVVLGFKSDKRPKFPKTLFVR